MLLVKFIQVPIQTRLGHRLGVPIYAEVLGAIGDRGTPTRGNRINHPNDIRILILSRNAPYLSEYDKVSLH